MAKYTEWLEPEKLEILTKWGKDGLIDAEIATRMGIVKSTLYEWKNKYADISDALKKGKEVADHEVEQALFKKTLGYKVELTKTFKVKHIKYNNGKRISEDETLETGIDEIYITPDTTAQIFWLKNRKPSEWRDKKDFEMSGKIEKAEDTLIKIREVANDRD